MASILKEKEVLQSSAVEISKNGWDQADTVILARNDDYADALSVATENDFADSLTGAVLAAKNKIAILLVRNHLTEETENYILENNIKRLSLFGGKLAISENLEQSLEKILKE